jgi:type IV secretory pathway TrbF-like protein
MDIMQSGMPKVETPSAIYLAGRREWNERYGSYISRAKHWRLAAMCSIAALAVSSLSNVWLAQQAHVVPYIVQVDKLGEAVAVHRVPVSPPVDAIRIRAQLARWISDTRTVYSDPTAELNIVTEGYSWVDRQSDATGQLDAWFRANNPNERAKKETVGVSIESVGQIGADTWSVDWSEDRTTKDGLAPTRSYWRASVKIKIDPPRDDASLIANPSGLYVEWFQTTPRVR